ncbi:hypothetical protein PFISCL1PPCAC_5266, partial [Pristionchus fissidentatus]
SFSLAVCLSIVFRSFVLSFPTPVCSRSSSSSSFSRPVFISPGFWSSSLPMAVSRRVLVACVVSRVLEGCVWRVWRVRPLSSLRNRACRGALRGAQSLLVRRRHGSGQLRWLVSLGRWLIAFISAVLDGTRRRRAHLRSVALLGASREILLLALFRLTAEQRCRLSAVRCLQSSAVARSGSGIVVLR